MTGGSIATDVESVTKISMPGRWFSCFYKKTEKLLGLYILIVLILLLHTMALLGEIDLLHGPNLQSMGYGKEAGDNNEIHCRAWT